MIREPKLRYKVRLFNTRGNHFKEWRAELYSNGMVITRWGRIGSSLQFKKFPFAGMDFLMEKEDEKIKKGYRYA